MYRLTTTTGLSATSKELGVSPSSDLIAFYRRDEFVILIRHAYRKLTGGRPLPVYGVKFKNLKEFTTTKKDRKRGINRIP
jgi:hypothetical protein